MPKQRLYTKKKINRVKKTNKKYKKTILKRKKKTIKRLTSVPKLKVKMNGKRR